MVQHGHLCKVKVGRYKVEPPYVYTGPSIKDIYMYITFTSLHVQDASTVCRCQTAFAQYEVACEG